jgi:transposase-like protein
LGERVSLTTDERAELTRLRRENRTLRMEQEILKAAVFFTTETDEIRWPCSGSSSERRPSTR